MNSVWTLFGVLLICGFLYVRVESVAVSCRIPSGQKYESSRYRPMYGPVQKTYRPMERVRHLTRVIVVCKKDVYHDAIRHSHKTKCINGKWTPELPSCEVKRRCHAPEAVANATSSRQLDQYVTFPHGGMVTFTCKAGMVSVGNRTTTCLDGVWSAMSLRCEERPPTTPVAEPATKESCGDVVVPNGEVMPVRGIRGKFIVLCKQGTTLKVSAETFTCLHGKWTGVKPMCVPYDKSRRCRYPYRIRRITTLTSKSTGERIKSYFIPEGTQVTQTCNRIPGLKRHTICQNRKWSPPLMKCRSHGNRFMYRQAVNKNCTIPVSDENVTYVVEGVELVSYAGGYTVETGQTIKRTCYFDTPSMGLSSVETTIHCVNGEWKPKLKRCEKLKDVNYKIQIKTYSDTNEYPVGVVIAGTKGRKTRLELQNFTTNTNDVREYDVNGTNVGQLRKIWIETPDPVHQFSIRFVSVYHPVISMYYISRNVDIHNQSRKELCPRQFRTPLKWTPELSTLGEYAELHKVEDSLSCKLACISERGFRCGAAVFDNNSCYIIKQLDQENVRVMPDVQSMLFIRQDECV